VFEPRSLCSTALAEMAALHWTYLNRFWHPDVVQGWIDDGCAGEITDRLGYRFVLWEARISEAVAPGGRLHVELDLRNDGFAAPFNPRPVELVLSNETQTLTAAWDVDPRTWEPGTTTIAADFGIPVTLEGTWTVSLRLPDRAESLAGRPEYAIRLAVDGAWDEAGGWNTLTTVPVTPTAGGRIDPEASRFSQLR
jgi:hypothetical protein